MTTLQQAQTALRIAVDTLHATATASPEAEYAVHECFAALQALGIDTRHSEDGKPRKTWADRVSPPPPPGLF